MVEAEDNNEDEQWGQKFFEYEFKFSYNFRRYFFEKRKETIILIRDYLT